MTFSVALVGPDGAGKTSVARALVDALPLPATYLYMGVSVESSNRVLPTTRVLRWLRRRRGASSQGRRSGEKPRSFGAGPARSGLRGSLRASLRLANRVAEEWYRQLLVLWHKSRGRVVVFDRHFFADFYTTDVRGQDATLSRRLHGLVLRRFYPRPDLVIYLDAPAEVLFARKREASVETLAAMRRNYEALAASGLRYAVVDASRPLDLVVADVAGLVTHYARHRALPAGPAPRPA